MKKRYIFLMITVFLVSGYFFFQNTQSKARAVNISYTKDIQPIFQSRCASCHIGKAKSAGLNLGSYESLMAGSEDGPVIVAGDAGQSYLVAKITVGEMPKRGPKLTPAQIKLITDWVNAGAIDN